MLTLTQEVNQAAAARQIEQAFERIENYWTQDAIRSRAATAQLK